MKKGIKVLNEEVTKKDVNDIVDRKINSLLSSKDFKKEVLGIVLDVYEDYVKEIYNRRQTIKNALKR